ncbi:MAG: 2-isopropylmalate synthase [Candidatus Lambdaproteobacteria bacterium RIFOXYD1_FULL_56_27]|uniref:2-isopropylmalate synthase n=1 Tax=Candidatus Lambdaproteobacteria bacterium RIFOXYD2_FULL_56_26 TaxID=1817773 RepID=A0A1F6H2V4_9PROT|nr:MAG: 2-isopropylmalate synthase [Candidatus Lambdaproteobacteria bacterium RIFOXYD2_FULL_56_26]OGH05350.1 MAG: 2-isopropylmalate synthase [Candidatus Lambdaproteobacteria bacterium RIFOXYC1_FULL_56_13]OGH09192.1 MAG: 2-isopropylmalate synthase [Candidatus Lambdaproteobacteria bacterium RIFOXYD1_FULL_56_27]
MDPNRIFIFDTSLRDGEQSPGCSMNKEEKLLLARQLQRLGVDSIEAGFAASSPGDFDSVQMIGHELKGPRVVSLCRVIDSDIDAGINALKGSHNWGIHCFISTSDLHLKEKLKIDRKTAIQKAVRAVERARKESDSIEFSCEDATRSDPEFLVEICSAVVKAGATILNLPDTVGYTTPGEITQMFSRLKNEVYNADQVVFSTHCHNDLGLAVANSLAAIQGGATQVECTLNGIGERAGNAALEEIVMALVVRGAFFGKQTGVDSTQLIHSSRLLTKLTGSLVQANKAIVGDNAFAHESGIHQDGVLKNRLTYEIMTPASVGLAKNNLVLGKHSGRAALLERVRDLGYQVGEEEIVRIFDEFKKLADKKKVVYDEDIELLVAGDRVQKVEKYKLLNLSVFSGTDSLPTATVRMEADGRHLPPHAAIGAGPIDAALNSIREIVGSSCILTKFSVKSITGGTDAQGMVSIGIEDEGLATSGRGSETDILIASAKAFVDALNRMEILKHSQGKRQQAAV